MSRKPEQETSSLSSAQTTGSGDAPEPAAPDLDLDIEAIDSGGVLKEGFSGQEM